MQVAAPFTDLCRTPGQGRDKHLLMGQQFRVLGSTDGWAYGFDPIDGYVGYALENDLAPHQSPTHRVSVRSAHIYSKPDMKSVEIAAVPFFSELAVTTVADGFATLAQGGFVATQHIQPLSWCADDPATIARIFFGTPYLWGGNTGFGIDCSGLVQMSLYAAGRACPRDSDLQEAAWPLEINRPDLRRNDLVFWKGHVGMMLDNTTLIHANAHHMQVVAEPLDQAIKRIGAKEFGAVTGFGRPWG